jgi:hypothetical protein
MGGECSTHGRYEKFVHFGWEKLKERDHYENIGIDERIILE